MGKKKKKIEFSSEEIDYLSGLVEAQRSKILILDKEQREQKFIRADLNIANRITKTLDRIS